MTLGTRLFDLRKGKKESLQDVADVVEVSKAHIWEIEKERAKNPSMDLVTRLADHFGVSVAFLMGEDSNAEDASPELQRMFRQASALPERDRKIVDEMIQSLIKNRSKQ
ncbi:MAG: helix-turn-helix domain-containing protein [Alphaproteobacteria bacterium]